MTLRAIAFGLTLTCLGCSNGTPSSGGKLLNPPAADKARVEEILKEFGIELSVVAMRDGGDRWMTTLAQRPSANEAEPSLSMPPVFKVFKDGRLASADGLTVKKR